jgi:hypothetical protein
MPRRAGLSSGALAVPTNAQLEEAAEFGAVALFVERAACGDCAFGWPATTSRSVRRHLPALDGIRCHRAGRCGACRCSVHGLHARLNQMFNVLSGGHA